MTFHDTHCQMRRAGRQGYIFSSNFNWSADSFFTKTFNASEKIIQYPMQFNTRTVRYLSEQTFTYQALVVEDCSQELVSILISKFVEMKKHRTFDL